MAVGTVSTRILTDIANAIRHQAGAATTHLPREMAAAVAALDGTNAGGYVEQPYKALESGVLSRSVFDDIAEAIRGQNGEATAYRPGDMTAAILALSWDTGLKVRALLLTDGTLEFSYRDGGTCLPETVARRFEVATEGYSSATDRPWDPVKLEVARVVFDPTFADAGMTNLAYLCMSFSNCTEVSGFQHCAGATDVRQMFSGCGSLETIYATGFDHSTITSHASVLYGCNRLVGGADGFVPTSTSGKAVLKVGAGGVLTDPDNAMRTWFHAFYYADGTGVLSASPAADASRTFVATNRICAIGRYQGLGFTPWDGMTGATHREHLTQATFAADMVTFTCLNLNYLFYGCTNLAAVTGLGNLANVRCMRFTFASAAVTELDLRGFDPSALADVTYCFSGCSSLVTIWADAGWALPGSGLTGPQCFYNCNSLVGGNGTAWESSKTGYAYLRIDAAGTPGYLTAG